MPSGYVASAYNAPLVSHLAYSAPIAHHNLAYSAPIAHHHLAYSAPLAAHVGHVAASEDTVVAGPSGTIATSKTVGAPAVAASYAVPHAYSYGGLYL